MPANLVRVATGRAWPVVPGPGRVKRGARIVRSCCLVRALQLLPVAAWAVGRAAWFAVIRWPLTAARAVIPWLINAAAAVIRRQVRAAWTWCRWLPSAAWWLPADLVAQLLPVAAWSRSCCLLPCLCLCSWSVRVCDPVPRFTNTRAALPGPRSVARVPGCLVRGHRSARPGA